jgi:hypothetical protein
MASVVGPEALLSRMVFAPTPALSAPILTVMGGESLYDIVSDFLMGSGIPCPGLFAIAQHHFSDVVDLTHINSSMFRAQIFAWAVTGAPLLSPVLNDISVSFYFPLHASY